MEPADCIDEFAVRRLFVYLKENFSFEAIRDELIQRGLLYNKEIEDFVCRDQNKHFRSERLLKLIIRKKRCKEFVALIKEMPCQRHISKKISDFQILIYTTQPASTDSNRIIETTPSFELTDELLQKHFAFLFMDLEPREIADEMFQNGDFSISEHDDVTTSNLKHKRLSWLLTILKRNQNYVPFLCTLKSLKKFSVLDTLENDREPEKSLSEYANCIQLNFTHLLDELPDSALIIMEHVLDQSNISDIESCSGTRRQKSKLLKILLMKGELACKELFGAVKVDLKREDLIQIMTRRSAEINERGMPDLSPRLNSLLILCLEVHKEMLYDELEPLDLSDLLFEERAIEILTHDKITETRQRQKQIKRLLETVQKNENNCFHFFLYILQRNEYNYIRKKLEGPAPEPLKRESGEQMKWRLSHLIKQVPENVEEQSITLLMTVQGSSGAVVEKDLYQRIIDSGTGPLEQTIWNANMEIEDFSFGSLVFQLRPVTDHAVQKLLDAKNNNNLLEMIYEILKKINITDIIDGAEPLEIELQISYTNSSRANPETALAKADLIKKRTTVHRDAIFYALEPSVLAPELHTRAEYIRKKVRSNYKNILDEMQMTLVKETLSQCIGDVDTIREKCLPRNGTRRQRMNNFLQFILQDDHNVVEFEKILRTNGLQKLLEVNKDVQEEHLPTPGIEVRVVEDHILPSSPSSGGVLFESIITLSYSVGPEKSSEEDEDEQNNIAQNGAETSNLRWFFRNIKGLFRVAVYFLVRSITEYGENIVEENDSENSTKTTNRQEKSEKSRLLVDIKKLHSKHTPLLLSNLKKDTKQSTKNCQIS